ncbi:MAG TPA: CBS domain-containing protein [Burkholderiaceae bacterium]|nr:CBS domain-containing protein [Burkholderiaceae bacterium]
MKVREILKVKGNILFTVGPDTLLSDAVMTLDEQDIGSLVVMSEGRLAGMLTFREVNRVMAKRLRENLAGPTPTMAQIPVKEVMNASPTVASPEMTVDELREVMNACGERYLPVMDGVELLGVVSFHDVARAVLEAQNFENRMLRAYIKDWPGEENPS